MAEAIMIFAAATICITTISTYYGKHVDGDGDAGRGGDSEEGECCETEEMMLPMKMVVFRV